MEQITTNYQNHMKSRGLASSTQATYLAEFRAFVKYFQGKDYRYIAKDEIIGYLANLYDLGYSSSKINQAINAVKFYREKVLGQKRQTYFMKRPRRQKFIPNILSQKQMSDVLNSPANLKHRALLFTIYDNGLRKGELINLKLSDVRTKVDDPHIIIRGAKHGGDRIIYLSPKCLSMIRSYYFVFRPAVYLFEGAAKGTPISETTVANVLKHALKRNKITNRFRVHDLRHNFATHCLQNGTDIYHLSKLLGHRSVETTQKYYAHLLPDQVIIKRPEPERETRIIQLKKAI